MKVRGAVDEQVGTSALRRLYIVCYFTESSDNDCSAGAEILANTFCGRHNGFQAWQT